MWWSLLAMVLCHQSNRRQKVPLNDPLHTFLYTHMCHAVICRPSIRMTVCVWGSPLRVEPSLLAMMASQGEISHRADLVQVQPSPCPLPLPPHSLVGTAHPAQPDRRQVPDGRGGWEQGHISLHSGKQGSHPDPPPLVMWPSQGPST